MLAGLAFLYRDLTRAPKDAPILKFGAVNRLAISLAGHQVELRKSERWQVTTFDGSAVTDARANEGLVRHLIDLLNGLREQRSEKMNLKQASQYGMATPALGISLGWDAPTPGEDAVLFGNKDLSGSFVYAFFPKKLLLTLTSANPLLLMDGKTALDFRDRRVTTFGVDDVYELRTAGTCKPIWLVRDGDRWVWHTPKANVENQDGIDAWLEDLIGQKADSIHDGATAPANSRNLCTVTLRGLYGKIEKFAFFRDSTGRILVKNDVLKALYLPSARMKKILSIK
ncbi:MAG: DUF4340 domain-containing protein [Deltaproteobacteria bacterium]|nr:DUF4340 domain-containing protein [Deltaproteobacteria bacterium]